RSRTWQSFEPFGSPGGPSTAAARLTALNLDSARFADCRAGVVDRPLRSAEPEAPPRCFEVSERALAGTRIRARTVVAPPISFLGRKTVRYASRESPPAASRERYSKESSMIDEVGLVRRSPYALALLRIVS